MKKLRLRETTTDDLVTVAAGRSRGRGSRSNDRGQFDGERRSDVDDGWGSLESLPPFKTEVAVERARTIISTNESPDIPFDQSINPYRGCEHGCSYCYARPTHAYLNLSPGLDFESKLTAKTNAAEQLERELATPGYVPKMIALGTNTDPYQPIERTYRLTRGVLEVLQRARHPVGIVTKSAMIVRDIDILADLARDGLARVYLSVTSLDHTVSRKMEPRASTPQRRLDALRELTAAGVPTGVMVAPIIPAINDVEIERILTACRAAGATSAGYVLLRMPLEIKALFREWLATEFPERAARVVHLMQSMRAGKDYDAWWFQRQHGSGPYAQLIASRFELAVRRLGMRRDRLTQRTDLFVPPVLVGGQMRLL